MSPEIRAGLARIQTETSRSSNKQEDKGYVAIKRAEYPRSSGYTNTKRISFTANWRK